MDLSAELRQEMTISLWYKTGAEFAVECFAWCTPDGALPASVGEGDAPSTDALEASGKVVHLGGEDGGEFTLSPNFVFELAFGGGRSFRQEIQSIKIKHNLI
jgi:hypothetical protein